MKHHLVLILFLLIGVIAVFFQFTETGNELILNNTDRETTVDTASYDLTVQSFTVGNEGALTIPEDRNSSIPVSFKLNNSKHGLRGLEMNNVSYRVNLTNSDTRLCNTDWVSVENKLEPGESFSTDLSQISEGFGFSECQLDQPTQNLTAVLGLKYAYRAQSTIMSQLVEDTNSRSPKYSQTAEIPVKGEMSLMHPVTTDTTSLNVSFKTTKPVDYKVDELQLITGNNVSENCEFSDITNQSWRNNNEDSSTKCELSFPQSTDQDFAIRLESGFTVRKEIDKTFDVVEN